jgi:hypothetical protein
MVEIRPECRLWPVREVEKILPVDHGRFLQPPRIEDGQKLLNIPHKQVNFRHYYPGIQY